MIIIYREYSIEFSPKQAHTHTHTYQIKENLCEFWVRIRYTVRVKGERIWGWEDNFIQLCLMLFILSRIHIYIVFSMYIVKNLIQLFCAVEICEKVWMYVCGFFVWRDFGVMLSFSFVFYQKVFSLFHCYFLYMIGRLRTEAGKIMFVIFFMKYCYLWIKH